MALLVAPAAFANFITPKAGGSPNSSKIDSLYKIILYIAAVVFMIVVGTLLYSLFKFRAKKGAVAAQIHGNTRLEVSWTVAAALILVAITVVTFVKLGGKVDAVPGYTTYTWFKALHPGLFHGQCAQLCGRNHAAMLAQVRVVPPAQYQAWLTQQQKLINQANDQVGTLRQSLTQEGQL